MIKSRIKSSKKRKDYLGFKYFVIYAIISTIIGIIYVKREAIIEKFTQKFPKIFETPQSEKLIEEPKKELKYWHICIDEWNPNGNLRSMDRVFEKLNYKFVNGSLGDDWDFIWSKEYPDYNQDKIYPPINTVPLKKHQKINHFPGNVALVGKSRMSTINKDLKYILPAFRPESIDKLKEYVKKNPHKKFVEKNKHNRGVKIINTSQIDPEKPETFYQVFLDKPFLFDGHSVDVGIFVLITSVNPLRIYRFNEEILLRFCPEKYYPFDDKIRGKYVVADDHKPTYEMDGIKNIFKDYKFTFKTIFERYIRKQGRSVEKMWQQVDDAIARIVIKSEKYMIEDLKEFSYSSTNFFELVRFDFVFDEDMNPFVMEVNMSPNMTPAEDKFEQNSLIYEQIIYNTVKMVGGGSYQEFWSRFNNDTTIVHHKNIAVDIDNCVERACKRNCQLPECRLCLPCLSDDTYYQFTEAYREHIHVGNFHRIFPTQVHFRDDNLWRSMSDENQIMMDWFWEKCRMDKRWC